MLRKLWIVSLITVMGLNVSYASNVQELSLSSSKATPYQAWGNQPLVTESSGVLVSHPNVKVLAEDLALANDLSYAVGKRHACLYFLSNIDSYVPNESKPDFISQLTFQEGAQARKIDSILQILRKSGWTTALKDLNTSIIMGKSGCVKALAQKEDTTTKFHNLMCLLSEGKNSDAKEIFDTIDSGMVDNHAGVALYHEPTRTFLAVFHGSRGDDYLPHSYDWQANLDTEEADLITGINYEKPEIEGMLENFKHLGRAHRGFTATATMLQPSLQWIIRQFVNQNQNAAQKFLFTGHSHGAAVSCMALIQAIDSFRDMLGEDFNNANSNLFGHYGISEPAAVSVDSLAAVQELYGKGNFLTPSVIHDPVLQFFRAGFWKGYDDLVSEKFKGALQILSGLKTTEKLTTVFSVMANPHERIKFEHVGYVASEPLMDVFKRQALNGVQKTLVFMAAQIENVHGAPHEICKTFIAGIHYGGEDAVFDHRLPGGIGNRLDTMLAYARDHPMTVVQYVEDIKSIPHTLGGMIMDLNESVNQLHPAIKGTALIAGAAVTGVAIHSLLKDRENNEETNLPKVVGTAAVATVTLYAGWKVVSALHGWWTTPSTEVKLLENRNQDKTEANKQLEEK